MQQTTDRAARFGRIASFLLLIGSGIAGCGPNYSPNTYSSTAVQQANKVDQAVVVGVRQVDITAQANVGTVVGGGVGGIAGGAAGDTSIGSALGALGGSVLGGIVGSTVEHSTADTQGYEYIVRKTNGDLLSVTQKDTAPLAIGTHVLIIAGNQARIVPDYTVTMESDKPATKAAETATPEAKPPVAASEPTPPIAASEPQPATAEPAAAPASAHVAITETPLAKEAASPAAPELPTAMAPTEPPPAVPDSAPAAPAP